MMYYTRLGGKGIHFSVNKSVEHLQFILPMLEQHSIIPASLYFYQCTIISAQHINQHFIFELTVYTGQCSD